MTADRTTSITSWIEITRGRVELEPGETKVIPITVRINPEVVSGEYHAFIGFPEGSNRPEAETLVYNGSVPGTILRIGVDKVQDQFLKIEKFSVDRFVKGSQEGQILVVLQNPGEDPVIPGGEIIFYDNHGIEINAIALNTGTTTIEGKQSVPFTLQVPKDMVVGKYKAFLSVEYGKDQKASLNDTAFFYVLPLKQVLIVFFVVLTLSILLALYVHRRFDREEDDYGATNIAMYVRTTRSESKDHDINLSNKDSD